MSYLGPSSSFKFMVALREIVADMEKRTSIRDHFPSGRESMAIEEQASDDKDIEVDNDGPVPDSGTNGGINGPIAQPGPRFALFTTPGQSRYNAPLPDSWAVASPASANGSLRSRSSPHVEGRRSSIVDSIRDTLPSRQTSDMLVEAFFDYVHVNYVIFHRGMFQMQYESLFTSPEDRDHEGDIGPSDSSRNKIDMGWICCIYMVFVFGQQALKDKRPEQAPRLRHNYVKLAQKHFYQVLSSTSLSNVQALLIMQLYQHNSSERNASWMLLGCACRMAVSMGMHREGARGGFSPIERELRRRVWWTMYTFEKQLSLTLGRPSAIPEDGEVNVGLPDENYMDGKAYYQPGLLDNMLSLTDILIRIRKSFFAAADCSSGVNPGIRRDTHSQIQSLDPDTARTFISQLDEWFHKLPPDHQLHSNAKGSNHNRAAHLLHLIYYYAKQVVLRSYVLQWLEMELAGRDGLNDHGRAQTSAGDPHQKELCQVCLDAAVSSLSIIESLWENNQVDGVAWIDIYWAYHSGVMLLINLLRERHAVRHTRTTTTSDQPTREAQFAVESRAIIKRLVKIMHKVNLCKTMSVFATVTVKLARVVEVNLEDEPDDMHVPVVDLAAEAVHGLVPSPATAHNNLSDLNTANFWSMEHMAHTDTLLFNSWTEADFLFPMATDGTDEFGWMQL